MRNKNVWIIGRWLNHKESSADTNARRGKNRKVRKKFPLSKPFLLWLLPLAAFADGTSPGSKKGIPIPVERHKALPHYLMTAVDRGKAFERIAGGPGTTNH